MAIREFYFKEQELLGKMGEEQFLIDFGHKWTKNNSNNPLEPDFVSKDGKYKLELKTDTYVLDSANVFNKGTSEGFTKNFFLEQYSDKNRRTDGGFFRAYKEGVSWLAYSFFTESSKDFNKRIYFFIRVNKEVMEKVSKICSEGRVLNIRNRGYITSGVTIQVDRFLEIIGKKNYFIKIPGLNVENESNKYWFKTIEKFCSGQDIYEAFYDFSTISMRFAKNAILNYHDEIGETSNTPNEINPHQLIRYLSKPKIYNKNFFKLDLSEMKDMVVILDPPHKDGDNFYSFNRYWERVEEITKIAKTVIIFDYAHNLEKADIPIFSQKMRIVDSGYNDFIECISIFNNGSWLRNKL